MIDWHRKLLCYYGAHEFDNGTLYLKRVGESCFDVYEECGYCHIRVKTGSIETPSPESMKNLNIKILEDQQ